MAAPNRSFVQFLLQKDTLPESLVTGLTQRVEAGASADDVFKWLLQVPEVPPQHIWQLKAAWLGVPFVDLSVTNTDSRLSGRLSSALAQRYKAIVIDKTPSGAIRVGLAQPRDILAVDAIERALQSSISVALIDPAMLSNRTAANVELESLAQAANAELRDRQRSYELDEIARVGDSDGAALGRLLRSLFTDACRIGASDVHIQPEPEGIRLRMRVDGCLREQWLGEPLLTPPLVSRLKLLAGLDIAERRLPQDGRFVIDVEGQGIDVRVSTLPVGDVETVCMRLMDVDRQQMQLEQLGMTVEQRDKLQSILSKPHGLVLIAGPTGSGKTTTVYASLQKLNTPDRKIMTVEDPVEYHLPRLTQIQVQPAIGLDFARVLRSALRHDPDVLAVGEMRDPETASIAMRAALTGHVVLSTVHASTAESALARLLDLGVERYVVNAGLSAIIAQRLLRKLCRHCITPAETSSPARAWLDDITAKGLIDDEKSNANYLTAKGCKQCGNTGYRGRIAAFDVRTFQVSAQDEVAAAGGGLLSAAMGHALAGKTSLEEIMRVFGSDIGGSATTARDQNVDVSDLRLVS